MDNLSPLKINIMSPDGTHSDCSSSLVTSVCQNFIPLDICNTKENVISDCTQAYAKEVLTLGMLYNEFKDAITCTLKKEVHCTARER